MSSAYDQYIDNGTKKIMDLYSSKKINKEERDAIITYFSKELINNIGNTEKLRDCEVVIYTGAVLFDDNEISRIIKNSNASIDDYRKGILYCTHQQQFLKELRDKKCSAPKVVNSSPENCSVMFQRKIDQRSTIDKIKEEDEKISKLLITAKEKYSTDDCDQIDELINELEQDITVCKRNNTPIPPIDNYDTIKTRNTVKTIRNRINQRNDLYKEIYSTDTQIRILVTTSTTTKQRDELISLCRKQICLFDECKDKKWALPKVKYTDPVAVIDQCTLCIKQDNLFEEMQQLDHEITRIINHLSKDRNYLKLSNECNALQKKIDLCRQNGWEVPHLTNSKPEKLLEQKLDERIIRKKRKAAIKRIVCLFFVLACVVALSVIILHKYRDGKSKIPFNSVAVINRNLEEIHDELKKAGFVNIVAKPDKAGWLESGRVTNVVIDGKDKYKKGRYLDPNVSVIINYSDENRIYVTELLADWKNKNYTKISKTLKAAGFTNVSTDKVATSDKKLNNIMSSITLDGKEYINEQCYLSKSAPIVISYYELKIGIGFNNAQFVGQNYKKVISNLKESGFTNVQSQQVRTGWAKGGDVVEVTVNNLNNYQSGDLFAPDVKILVKHSRNDRINITPLLLKWKELNYEDLIQLLQERELESITTEAVSTNEKNKNHHVAGITFNGEEFISGDCYLTKNTDIVIKYYSLQIPIIQNAKDFNLKDYTEVVDLLRKMGFMNIHVKRANDIGWFPWHDPAGTIKSISIDGNSDFSETDIFDQNAEIEIVVHTANSDFDDIVEIA